MAFVKGSFYRCVDNKTTYSVLPLTIGKLYECQDYSAGINAVAVTNDVGGTYWCEESRFDPTPVGQLAPSPVAAHAAWKSSQGTQPAPPPGVRAGTKLCACGKQAEKKVFATFEYYYCSACKTEVGGKDEAKPAKAQLADADVAGAFRYMAPRPTPFGVAALAGDDLICPNCSDLIGKLGKDLPDLNADIILRSAILAPFQSHCFTCGSYVGGPGCSVFVRGRGWV